LNPLQAAQFRRSQGKRAKTDRLDAQALALFLVARAPRPQPVPSPTLVALRELTRFRADLLDQRTAVLDQLIGAVDLSFPELPRLLHDLRGRTGLTLLAQYPTASAIAAADPRCLTELLHQASRGHFGSARVARLMDSARTSVALREAAEVAALELIIAEHFSQLGYRPADFPAGGIVTLATLVAEAGPVDRYPTAKHLVAYFGWCPVDRQSGSYKDPHPRLSQAGNRYVRRILWMLAIHVISRPGPYQEYFQRRTAIGKPQDGLHRGCRTQTADHHIRHSEEWSPVRPYPILPRYPPPRSYRLTRRIGINGAGSYAKDSGQVRAEWLGLTGRLGRAG
jgi:transposase